MNFVIKDGHDYIEVIRTLFVEYVQSLGVSANPKEFDGIEKKYRGEREALYIGFVGDEPAGCVAIRQVTADKAEMKRLYVRPEFRGTGLGMALAQLVVDESKKMGYTRLILDSLPSMERAVNLYTNLGFKRTDGHTQTPIKNIVHLTLPLVEE